MLSVEQVLSLLSDKRNPIWERQGRLLKMWRDVYYGMSLHTTGVCPLYTASRPDGTSIDIVPTGTFNRRYQDIFDFKLFSKHNREPWDTRNWRYSQYRPHQKAPFQQIIEVLGGAIFQDSGYNITIDNKYDAKYLLKENNFNGHDLIGYIVWSLQSIVEDPNGYFVIIPKDPYYNTTTTDIRPDIWFVHSKDIIYVTPEDVLFNRDGYTWHVNKVDIFRYEEVDKGSDGVAAAYTLMSEDAPYLGYYSHNLGYLPCYIAGGQWNTHGYFDSWLDKAKAIADDFVSAKSGEQLADKEALHPFIIAASEDCPSCDQHSGHVQIECNHDQNNGVLDGCIVCNGMGYIRATCGTCHGAGTIYYSPGQWMKADKEDMGNTLIQVVNFDVNINKQFHETCKDLLQQMLRALHLNYIEQAQSGIAKDKDMETRFQFISRISNDLFDRLITGLIRTIISYRNVRAENNSIVPHAYDFIITKPTQFGIKTAQELLLEYQTSSLANVPAFVRSQQIEDYIDKQFGGNDILKRKSSLIIQMDSMSVLSAADKTALVNGGAASNRDYQFSFELPKIIDQIVREKGKEWFIQAEYDVIKSEVDKIFNLIPKIDPPINKLETPKDTSSQSSPKPVIK